MAHTESRKAHSRPCQRERRDNCRRQQFIEHHTESTNACPDAVWASVPSYSRATFAASARSTVFTWNTVNPGCLPRILVTMPAMWGVAKLLPVAVM